MIRIVHDDTGYHVHMNQRVEGPPARENLDNETRAELSEAWELFANGAAELPRDKFETLFRSLGHNLSVDELLVGGRFSLPGAPSLSTSARSGETFSFDDLCAIIDNCCDGEGSHCILCDSIWSSLPGWDGKECERQKGFCSVFGDAVNAPTSDIRIPVASIPAGLDAVLAFSGVEDEWARRGVVGVREEIVDEAVALLTDQQEIISGSVSAGKAADAVGRVFMMEAR